MNRKEAWQKFAQRAGYSQQEMDSVSLEDPRARHVEKLAQAAGKYSILAEVQEAMGCNTGYKPGDRFLLDVDGNLISKLCPKRQCVYLVSQFMLPVALINERLSEGLDPNATHFAHQVRCQDVGVGCEGYGQVRVKVSVVPR
ncbi:MAG: hypothetical protein AB1814_18650 [Thermodesulfobacteriota bacterium]